MSTLHGDAPCAECGTTENIIWFTDDVLWNNVTRRKDNGHDGYQMNRWGKEPILCLPCFIGVVEGRGIRPVSWRVIPQYPVRRVPVEES